MPRRAKYVPKHARSTSTRAAGRGFGRNVAVAGAAVTALGVVAVTAAVIVGNVDDGDDAASTSTTMLQPVLETAAPSLVTTVPIPTAPVTAPSDGSSPASTAAPADSSPATIEASTTAAAPTGSTTATTAVPTTSAPGPATTATTAPVAPSTTAASTAGTATSLFSGAAPVGFAPGRYLVGDGPGQVPPGVHRTRSAPTGSGRCEITLYDGDTPRTALAAHGPVVVDTRGATSVRIGRLCPPLGADLGPILTPEQLTAPGGFPAGMYLASEIPAGVYEVLVDGRRPDPLTGRRCYWSIQMRFTGRQYPVTDGGDEIDKNAVTTRPQEPTFVILGWNPGFPDAGVLLDYRLPVENPEPGNPLHVPDAEIGECRFRKVG